MALGNLPYSPDLSPPDFFLFLKGQQFASTEGVSAKVMGALIEVLKNGFQECFQKLYKC
jgi:hypothetical protein